MKKIIPVLIGSFILDFLAPRVALGVWPASTSLEADRLTTEQRQLSQEMHPIIERLEKDEHQLAENVELLKQDEKRIQELTEIRGKTGSIQEDQNGHHLH